MKCAYHLEVDAVGACVNCGRFICAECKVVLGDRIYCNPCADKLFTETSIRQKTEGLNWYERHLNWTVVIAIAASYLMIYLAAYQASGVLAFILMLIGIFVVLFSAAWALDRKHRNRWWLLIFLVPFGWIAFFALENRSKSGKIDINKKLRDFAEKQRR